MKQITWKNAKRGESHVLLGVEEDGKVIFSIDRIPAGWRLCCNNEAVSVFDDIRDAQRDAERRLNKKGG